MARQEAVLRLLVFVYLPKIMRVSPVKLSVVSSSKSAQKLRLCRPMHMEVAFVLSHHFSRSTLE